MKSKSANYFFDYNTPMRRTEYWINLLAQLIVCSVGGVICILIMLFVMPANPAIGSVLGLCVASAFGIALLLPFVSMIARRSMDAFGNRWVGLIALAVLIILPYLLDSLLLNHEVAQVNIINGVLLLGVVLIIIFMGLFRTKRRTAKRKR